MTNRRRRSMVLVLMVLTLALTAAILSPLARVSGVSALVAAHEVAVLQHRLAAESIVAMLPQLLEKNSALRRALERNYGYSFGFELGPMTVEVFLQDDSAKLPATLAINEKARQALLIHLGSANLKFRSAVDVDGQPVQLVTGCLDDLFEEPVDAAIYGALDRRDGWANWITPIGQRVNLFNASPEVLEATLADVGNGLGQRLARLRAVATQPKLEDLLAGLELKEPELRKARERFTDHPERYSLLVRTRSGGDLQQRYLICSADDPPRVLADWEVAP